MCINMQISHGKQTINKQRCGEIQKIMQYKQRKIEENPLHLRMTHGMNSNGEISN